MIVLAIVYIGYLLILRFSYHDKSLFIYGYGVLALLCLIAAACLLAGLKFVGYIFAGLSCVLLLVGIAAIAFIALSPVPKKIAEPLAWITVLGCALYKRKPGRILLERLDLALAYHEKYPQVRIMVCGGQGNDEEVTEAAAMAEYLEEHGVPSAHIFQEATSASTKEGLENYARLCANVDASVVIVTSDFHALRVARAAKECGLSSFAIAASKTCSGLWVNLMLRDACAFFMAKLLPNFHNVWFGGKRL